jgi:hypothetical protein
MKDPQKNMLSCYLIGLVVMAAFAWLISVTIPLFPALAHAHWALQQIPAVLLTLAATVAHLLSRKKNNRAYLFSYFTNAVASGWAIGVLMGSKEILPAPELILALLPAAGVGILTALLVGRPKSRLRTVLSTLAVITAVCLFLSGIVVWNLLSPLMGCVLLFSALFLLPLPIGIAKAVDWPPDRFRYLSFAGFGAFFLILLVAAIVLSEGEILDGLDFDIGGGESAGTKKKNKPVK